MHCLRNIAMRNELLKMFEAVLTISLMASLPICLKSAQSYSGGILHGYVLPCTLYPSILHAPNCHTRAAVSHLVLERQYHTDTHYM